TAPNEPSPRWKASDGWPIPTTGPCCGGAACWNMERVRRIVPGRRWRRAGLLADSDVAKPGSPVAGAVAPAFMANWLTPFVPDAGGSILQLPVVANLEGDYLMDSGLLRRR